MTIQFDSLLRQNFRCGRMPGSRTLRRSGSAFYALAGVC